MNRRTFFKKSSLIIPGLGLGAVLSAPGKLFAEEMRLSSFSLSVVTDQSAKAIAMIQELLSRIKPQQKNIHYTEYVLPGAHMADIVFTQSGQLLDFRRNEGPVCDALRKIANRLDLPHSCENPVLSHFSFDSVMQKPVGFQVFKDNALILDKTFPEQAETFELEGLKGKVILEAAADHSVRFVDTSCNHKTCMSMGKINQAGQNLVCVPNQIYVAIAGTNISGVDSITF